MRKKWMAWLLTMCLLVGLTVPVLGEEAPPVGSAPPELLTQNAILMECTTGKVLYALNETQQRAPASVTKIMTMGLVLEQIQQGKLAMDDMVTASEHAKEMGGTQINLDTGEQMSVYDLLMSVAVASANDAAMALAEHIAGSEEGFVNMMNAKAQELGMENTHFVNPHGLPVEGHVTCAKDIAQMTRFLLSFEQSREFIGTQIYPIREGENEYKMRNTNNLLWSYNGCIGGKTGYTEDAGYCMSVAAERDGMTLIAVVMGEKTAAERTEDLEKLLDYGFGNFAVFNVPVEPVEPEPLKVKFGTVETAQVAVPDMTIAPQVITKGMTPEVKQDVTCKSECEAPLKAGQKVGEVTVTMDGEVVGSFDLTVEQAVERRTFGKAFGMLWKSIVTM